MTLLAVGREGFRAGMTSGMRSEKLGGSRPQVAEVGDEWSGKKCGREKPCTLDPSGSLAVAAAAVVAAAEAEAGPVPD